MNSIIEIEIGFFHIYIFQKLFIVFSLCSGNINEREEVFACQKAF